jgi:DNA-directed RNA polymerase specialized sigma24 family protein
MQSDEPGPLASTQERKTSASHFPGTDPARLVQVRADFIDFYVREHHRVVVFLINNGASRQAAEDAMQEAIAESWALAESGRWAEISNHRAWVRAVALRKYRRPPGPRTLPAAVLVPDLAETTDPAGFMDEVTAGTLLVREALLALPPALRAVIAFQMDGFSGPETAAYLGITAQQVRDLRKKARKILARRLAGPERRQRP